MSSTAFVAISTIMIVAVMTLTFVFIYVRSLYHESQRQWHVLLEKLNHRLDKIPHLLENFRKHVKGQEKLVQEIIDFRAKSRPVETLVVEKIQLELEISQKLGTIWQLSVSSPELQRDTDFLALKIELKAFENDIEKSLEPLNLRIRSYNRWLRFIVLKPLYLVFHFRKLSVFEFEKSFA